MPDAAAAPCKDAEELMRMMQTHGTAVKRLCVCLLNDPFLAEDAAQDTFCKAWKALASFRGACSERTWLFRIAVNTCRSMQRGFWAQHVERHTSFEQLALSTEASNAWDTTVWDAVQSLPKDLKQAVVLRYYEELSLKDSAEVLGVGVNTLNTRLRRARALLQRRLEGWYFDE